LTNCVIYLDNVSAQNSRTDGSGVCYEQLGYRASLISCHWILCRTPLFWELCKNSTKNVTVPSFGESS